MTTKSDAAKPGNDDSLRFEQALERLETLVDTMETGKMSLDDMLAAFEEGRRLVSFCDRKLNEVQRRIEILLKDEKGNAVVAPFDPASEIDGTDDAGPGET